VPLVVVELCRNRRVAENAIAARPVNTAPTTNLRSAYALRREFEHVAALSARCGRPALVLALALGFRDPFGCRSNIIARSKSAIAPSMVSSILPVAIETSKPGPSCAASHP
jgi:hypothetical protein